MQVHSKIERAGQAITEAGMELLRMAQDGRIDDDELARIPTLARQVISEANRVEDVVQDIDHAMTVLRHGRHYQSRRLRERDRDLQPLLQQTTPTALHTEGAEYERAA